MDCCGVWCVGTGILDMPSECSSRKESERRRLSFNIEDPLSTAATTKAFSTCSPPISAQWRPLSELSSLEAPQRIGELEVNNLQSETSRRRHALRETTLRRRTSHW